MTLSRVFSKNTSIWNKNGMVFLFHTYGWDHVSCCFLHAACFPDAVLATSDMDTICSDKVLIHTMDKYHRWPHMISSLPSSWIFYTRNPLNGLQNSSLCCRFAGVWIYSQVSPTLGLFAAFFQCCAAIVRVCESIVRSLQKCFTCGFLRLLCIYVIVGILGFCGFIVLLMMFLFSGCSPKGRGSFLDFDSPRLHEL
jgi:hypothetical protein